MVLQMIFRLYLVVIFYIPDDDDNVNDEYDDDSNNHDGCNNDDNGYDNNVNANQKNDNDNSGNYNDNNDEDDQAINAQSAFNPWLIVKGSQLKSFL